jgi:dipeptidase E
MFDAAGSDERGPMKLLLTSGGIKNASIDHALVDLLGKPISEANALFIPTAIYPFAGGPMQSMRAISGAAPSPLAQLGWKSLGILELTALSSIDRAVWADTVLSVDALLVWGGDPVYLAYWMEHSGLNELLSDAPDALVYVGVSAGAIATASTFGEVYHEVPRCSGDRLSSEHISFTVADGKQDLTLVMAHGVGLVDFSIIPHVEFDDPLDVANAELWASRLPLRTYALDDDSAVKVVDGRVDVVSEGSWRLFGR